MKAETGTTPHVLQTEEKAHLMKNKSILPFHSVTALLINGSLQFTNDKNKQGEGHLVTDERASLVQRAKADDATIQVYDTRFLLGKNKSAIMPHYFCRQKKSGDKINRDHLVPAPLARCWLVSQRGDNSFGSLNPELMAKNVNFGYVRACVRRLKLILRTSENVRDPRAVQLLKHQRLEYLALLNKAAQRNFESRLISKGKSTRTARAITKTETKRAQATMTTINDILNNASLRAAMAIWKGEQTKTAEAKAAKVRRDRQQKETREAKPEGFNTINGLTLVQEVSKLGTDPVDADSDDDGLMDGEEVDTTLTDPLDADSDDAGLIHVNTATSAAL